jgi:hypothetical protein
MTIIPTTARTLTLYNKTPTIAEVTLSVISNFFLPHISFSGYFDGIRAYNRRL